MSPCCCYTLYHQAHRTPLLQSNNLVRTNCCVIADNEKVILKGSSGQTGQHKLIGPRGRVCVILNQALVQGQPVREILVNTRQLLYCSVSYQQPQSTVEEVGTQ